MQTKSSERRSSRLLPPIIKAESSSGYNTPSSSRPQNAEDRPWSRFHSGCLVSRSIYMDWMSVKTDKNIYATYTGRISKRVNSRSSTSFPVAEEQEVMEYLTNNTDVLESYVTECVPMETLENWMFKKMNNIQTTLSPANEKKNKFKQKKHLGKKEKFTELLKVMKEDPSEHEILWELAGYIVSSLGVDGYRIYKLYPDHPSFVQYFVMDDQSTEGSSKILARADPGAVEVILEVAKAGACYRLSGTEDALHFRDAQRSLFRTLRVKEGKVVNHVMYQPILSKAGKTAYVIEMWRYKEMFKDVDEQISSNFLVLGSLALHYCNLYLDKKRESNMSDFLLDVVKAIFEEMVSLDQLIKRILEFAQRLVNADRASLFLVDSRNYELVSTVFDLKFERGHDRDMEKKEIRMPINRGIAGHVALSGETMNIPDAYSDYRFNREVDEATGYKTVSILCMPIKVEGRVIGVVQMVNKRNDDNFGHEDEVAFEIFSTFFGLALHHATLYDRIMRKEQKYRVALEVLSYHNTCRENEVQKMLSDVEPLNIDLNDFYLDPFKFDEYTKCKSVINMFKDLFDVSKFDIMTLTRFVLTIKKNYRTVPYHNFDHGWSVAHAMYVMLKRDHQKRFNHKMRLALFVASLCHDLDHRGYTNKYMNEIASPLAAMYTTSTLEHHHFNITVTILQQDGHNIFSHISSDDYKEILGSIRHCILATDLAAFFPNLALMKELHAAEARQKFDWTVNCHRNLAMAISMTAADLSASVKPWEIQIKTVKVIFEEFYDQGDKERAAGQEPIPMMDRYKPDEQPACQVGFLSQICIPCYKMLHTLLPDTEPMYEMAMKNLDRWRYRADRVRYKNEGIEITDANSEDGFCEVLTEDSDNDKNDIEATTSKATEFVNEEIVKDKNGEAKLSSIKLVKPKTESVLSDIKRDSVTWEEDEDEEIDRDEKILKSGILKNIDGVTWMDEEDVVVGVKAIKASVSSQNNGGI